MEDVTKTPAHTREKILANVKFDLYKISGKLEELLDTEDALDNRERLFVLDAQESVTRAIVRVGKAERVRGKKGG